MKKQMIPLLLLFPALFMRAQVPRRPLAAAYTGLGAYSFNHTDVFSARSNTAALAQLRHGSMGVYGERKFLIPELGSYSIAAAIKTSSGNFGLYANYMGFTSYNESRLCFAYGRSLGNKLDIGVQVNYNVLRISNDYGQASAIGFELGSIYHISDKLHTGFHASNPVGGSFGKTGERLTAVYSFGIGFDASERSLVSMTIEKEEDQPVNINAGIIYKFHQRLQARLGISSANSSPWMGIGFVVRSFRVDITAAYHPQLGLSPGILLLASFNNK